MNERQTVLVVDDERVNRTLLAEILKSECRVLLAKNGQQALDLVTQEAAQIDLILLDVMMPDMDGYEVITRLKQNDRSKDIPVIFITALTSQDDEERGFRLGASDYIAKPFNAAIVFARVCNQLRYVYQRKLLASLVGRDSLTDIANRRAFDEALERESGRNQRNGMPFSLAMIDVDFFKQFNDQYGHARGDWVLKSVARALKSAVSRPADFIARYGGEEFALILPDTDAKGAREVAENARRAVADLNIPHAGSQVESRVTVSIGGITVVGAEKTPLQLIELADARLYEAKQQGRNRVVWAA